MKIVLRVIGIIVLVMAVAAGGIWIYLTKDMKAVRALEVSSVDLTQVEDGVYNGTFDNGSRWSNQVTVTVEDHRITEITVLQPQKIDLAEQTRELFNKVLAEQRVDVDVVSGVTLTSLGYLKAIEDALD